jgi:hypothetical protein
MACHAPERRVTAADERAARRNWISFFGASRSIRSRAVVLEDGEQLSSTLERAAKRYPLAGAVARVDRVERSSGGLLLTYELVVGATVILSGIRGESVRVDGQWVVSRAAFCDLIATGGLRCPPE